MTVAFALVAITGLNFGVDIHEGNRTDCSARSLRTSLAEAISASVFVASAGLLYAATRGLDLVYCIIALCFLSALGALCTAFVEGGRCDAS